MKVEICYADASGATRISLELDEDAMLGEALNASRLVERLSLDLRNHSFGIFGKRAGLDAPLHEGDRIEIYRPLIVDPKDARRRRAEKKRAEAARIHAEAAATKGGGAE